ncbi:Vacuolar protease A [Phlyctochytrium planicorne]|nr:Vacuolar protease A [Phlyctochytrium planicorne]
MQQILTEDCEGIIGMSLVPSELDISAFPMFFQTLMQEKKLDFPMFAVVVHDDFDSGDVVLGGYDVNDFKDPTAPLSWIPVAPDSYKFRGLSASFKSLGYWALPLSSITTSLSSLPTFTYNSPQNLTVGIVDTGSNVATIPSQLYLALAGALGGVNDGSGLFWIPCDRKRIDGGPLISFNFEGGESIQVTAMEYVRALPFLDPVSVANPASSPGDPVNITSAAVQQCFLNLRAMDEGFNFITLGNAVTKRFVTIFDYENQRISFNLASGRVAAAPLSFMPQNESVSTTTGATTTIEPTKLPPTNPAPALSTVMDGRSIPTSAYSVLSDKTKSSSCRQSMPLLGIGGFLLLLLVAFH